MSKLSENTLSEQPIINWLKELGYDYEFGPDLAPGGSLQERKDFREVILIPRLKRSLVRLNPELSDEAIDGAVLKIIGVEHPSLDIANKEVYKLLTEGVKFEAKDKKGETKGRIAKVFDFENPLNNEFLVVNQFAIQGIENVRRPDLVIFINGIPIVLFEVKSPTTESGTVRSAFYQLQDYKKDIPDIFKYNQVLVISDLLQAKHGTISSSWEWFSTWKGIESEDEKNEGVSELEVLAQGMFNKIRLLDIIQNFIVFEADSEKDTSKFTKKICLYHQYFGVNKAIKETLRATGPRGNKKIGVFWHTQGSGKSLSMVFYVNKVKKLAELKSPTFVFLTDRNDLDGQLYKTFLRTGYPTAKQAETIKGLNEKLKTAGAELIFSTIQKFETENEILSERENIIVIADEAHRSQYAKLAGNVRVALPNASFMGITGTPISLHNRDTRLVFGEHISAYQINKAVEDGATVPIYYEGRLVPLHLTNDFIDEEFEDLMAEHEFEIKESVKRKWARLEQAVGSPQRLKQVAEDIVNHFNNRGLEGKGMVVTMSRRIAVEMYELISKIPEAPKIAVVVSKPEDFKGKIQKELNYKELEKQFKNPDDPLKIVVVCDMWLTGFDVPPLHTMYIDKPLKNHTLMQAIARVNRIFKDKLGGLIVDYIGIADNLKKALSIYSSDIRKEAMIPLQEIINKMLEKYDIVKDIFIGINYSNWKKLESINLAQLFQKAVNSVITDEKTGMLNEERKNRFLKESEILFKVFALAMPNHEAIKIRDDVTFFQAVKKAIIKRTVITGAAEIDIKIESALRELVSKSIVAEGVIDIFAMKDKNKPDISIFDEKFLEEVKNMKFKNLAIEALRKLLQDELRIRVRKNGVRYRSLAELLDQIIEEYENNIINSTKVIERLLELAREIKSAEKAGVNLGLSEEEVAFYDAISSSKKSELKNGELKDLVKELVNIIKRDLMVDWTNNEIIKSRIRANVRLLLLRNNFAPEETENVLNLVFDQAFSLYRDFSMVEVKNS
ncbi:MAG: type I restriction endonuclease subunit R [Caldisericia bacterium]|nr:type I restriction endonuclease subunit R [Caldisericia bacterium]